MTSDADSTSSSTGTAGPDRRLDPATLQSILEATADGILVVDLEGNIRHYNRRFVEMWDLPEEVLEQGDDDLALRHARDRLADPEAFLEGVRELYDRTEQERYDLLRFRDGRLIRRYSRPQTVDGEVVGRVWSFRDVSARLRAEEELRERTEVFRALVSASPLAIDVLNREGEVVLWNEAAERIFGWSAEEVRGGLPPMVPEEREGEFHSVMEDLLAGDRISGYETVRRRKDGSEVEVAVWAAPLHDAGGDVSGAVGLFADISERKEAERALRRSEARYRTLFEQSRDAIVISAPDGRVLDANPAAVEMAGYDPEDDRVAEMRAEDFYVDLDDREQFLEKMREDGYVEDFEVRYRTRDGEIMHCLENATVWRGPDGQVQGFLSVLRDVTEEKRMRRRLEEMAFTDPLTDLANRRLLEERAVDALARARRREESVGLLYLDLRRFKAVNDTLGHAAGDEALRLVKRRLSHRVRESDTLARVGGDEFAILLPRLASDRSALEAGRRVLEAFEEPFEIDGHPYRLGASVGIALHPRDADDFEALMHHADAAMYAASRSPGETLRLYRPGMGDTPRAASGLGEELERALADDGLELARQPIVRASDGAAVAEQMVPHWRHPNRGALPAGEIRPLAREGGFTRELDRWLLERAVARLPGGPDGGRAPGWITVRLSARSLADPSMPDRVREILAGAARDPAAVRFGDPEGGLAVEVTEAAATRDPEAAGRLLETVESMGIPVLLDRFGTGRSSLEHLRWLPVDVLKIDPVYVRDLGRVEGEEELVRAMIAMAHSLEMQVVARGVERPRQRRWLTSEGCDFLQGGLVGAAAVED